MNIFIAPIKLLAMVGVCLILAVGCAKKDIQSTSGSKSFEPGVASEDTSGSGNDMAGQSEGEFSEQNMAGQDSGSDSSMTSAYNSGDGASIIPGDSSEGTSEMSGMGSMDDMSGMGSAADSGSTDEGYPTFGSSDGNMNQDSLSGFGEVEPGQTPLEDRLDDGTLVAKADPNAAGSGMQDFQDGQFEGASQGLADVFFEYDSWSIPENAKANLSEGAAWLKAHPNSQLLVEGHCDERGSQAYNLVLGEKRAKAVLSYLLDLGVSANRMHIVSYGEERPFCERQDEQCYKMNRRGHLTVQTP